MTDPWSVFGDDSQSAGERFEFLYSKLVFYFTARRCDDPEELAHVTLERLMRRHSENVKVLDLMRYSYGVAENVLYEHVRKQKARQNYASEQKYRSRVGSDDDINAAVSKERRLRCLEQCVEGLSEQEREMLSGYYKGRGQAQQEYRLKMAEQLNITREALTLRVFHLKRKLKKCVVKCLGGS